MLCVNIVTLSGLHESDSLPAELMRRTKSAYIDALVCFFEPLLPSQTTGLRSS